jgi:FkbM family methyltransferase
MLMKTEDLQLIFEKALQKCSRLCGYELNPILSKKARPIDILRLAIHELMTEQKDIFFVQIGAHDGRTYDPISPHVRKHGWHGLLIEPQPDIFARLKTNYEGSPGLLFENVAIAEKEGSLTLYRFKEATADDHASMLASTKRHYLQLNGDNERGRIEAIQVPTTTLNRLLDKHGISNVDLLQIDTEGYDFPIIKSLDFTRLNPRIIHFENNFLSRRQKEESMRIFANHGYAVMDIGIDTLAYLQSEDSEFNLRMSMSKID